jgi:hypothetical protein
MNTIFMLLHYPENHFLHSISLLSLVLDGFYLYLFHWKKAKASR